MSAMFAVAGVGIHRRSILAATLLPVAATVAAAAIAGQAVAHLVAEAARPDALLLAACAAFERAEDAIRAREESRPAGDTDERLGTDLAAIAGEINRLATLVIGLPATTPAGYVARCRALASANREGECSTEMYDGGRLGDMVSALVRDALGLLGLPEPEQLPPLLDAAELRDLLGLPAMRAILWPADARP